MLCYVMLYGLLTVSSYVKYVERQAQKQAQRREEKASPSHLNRSWRRFQLALYLMKLVDFEMTATEVSRSVKETDGGEGEKETEMHTVCAVCRVPCAVCRVPCAVYYCSPNAASSPSTFPYFPFFLPFLPFLHSSPLFLSFQVKIERTPSSHFNPRRVPTPE